MTFRLRSFLCFATAFFLLGLVAYGQEKKQAPRYSGSVRGETYSYKYTDQDFASTPSWNGEDGEPPVSLPQALQIARTNLPRFVDDSKSFKMSFATLRLVGSDKWYYSVMFYCKAPSCRNAEVRSFQIIVKMDGNILEPKRIVLVD